MSLLTARDISSLNVALRYAGERFGINTKSDVIDNVVAQGKDPRRLHLSHVFGALLRFDGQAAPSFLL
jgi:hypothetical protein